MTVVQKPESMRLEMPVLSPFSHGVLAAAAPPIEIIAPRRQVQIVIDAGCELAPEQISGLGMTVLSREAKVDGRSVVLNDQRTLHHSCWPQPPRQVEWFAGALGDLAQTYRTAQAAGMSVLALHRPSALDPATRVALAARTITLAGRSTRDDGLRIAVYELTQIGTGFAFLVAAAAQAAAEGMPLHQLLTLLDRLQAAMHSFYLTGMSGPQETTRQPKQPQTVARLGSQQLWELDGKDGLFACRARGWNAAKTLAEGTGGKAQAVETGAPEAAVMLEPTAVVAQPARLLDQVNRQRAALQQPPFMLQPGGASLAPLFPRGCVELAQFPDATHIAQITDVIRRIDRSTPVPVATRRRGAVL